MAAALVIAKLGRLSRDAHFLLGLEKASLLGEIHTVRIGCHSFRHAHGAHRRLTRTDEVADRLMGAIWHPDQGVSSPGRCSLARIPRKPGERITTDRRDAINHNDGATTAHWCPAPVSCRLDAVAARPGLIAPMHEARYRTTRHNPRNPHTVRRVALSHGEHLV
jgi:hypothetical protein